MIAGTVAELRPDLPRLRAVVGFDHPTAAGQDRNEGIQQFVAGLMAQHFLMNMHLLFDHRPYAQGLPLLPDRRQTRMCRKACIVSHGDSSFSRGCPLTPLYATWVVIATPFFARACSLMVNL